MNVMKLIEMRLERTFESLFSYQRTQKEKEKKYQRMKIQHIVNPYFSITDKTKTTVGNLGN